MPPPSGCDFDPVEDPTETPSGRNLDFIVFCKELPLSPHPYDPYPLLLTTPLVPAPHIIPTPNGPLRYHRLLCCLMGTSSPSAAGPGKSTHHGSVLPCGRPSLTQVSGLKLPSSLCVESAPISAAALIAFTCPLRLSHLYLMQMECIIDLCEIRPPI